MYVYTQQNILFESVAKKTPDGLSAKASTKCIRTLCYPPTTFLFMWLRNKFVLLMWKAHKQQDFGPEMKDKISHLKVLHRTILFESGALAST